jgi:c-di-GMP-binding flagellar brake protein YcgR
VSASTLEFAFAPEEERYAVRAPVEIAALLRQAAREAVLMTVLYDTGTDFALTTVLGVDEVCAQLYLEAPRARACHERLLAAERLLVCSSQRGVRMKFVLARPRPALWAGRPALLAPLPRVLVRLQRREDYRVACPLADPLKCTIALASTGGMRRLELVVLDLSCGGLALALPCDADAFEPGMRLPDCTLALPEGATLRFALLVCGLAALPTRNGTQRWRLGCKFLDLSPACAVLLQRYVLELEGARRARYGRA